MKNTIFLVIALVYCLPVRADDNVTVNRLNTDIQVKDEGKTQQVIVSQSVEIEAPKDQTIAIYIQFFDQKGHQLNNDQNGLFRLWKHIVVPARSRDSNRNEKNKVIFNHVDVSFSFDDFSQCRLAADQDVLLYATCEVWRADRQQYVDRGWTDRTPLIVKTDAKGKVIEARPFPTRSFFKTESSYQAYERVSARRMNLETRHLKLKPNVKVFETKGLKHSSYPVLADGKVSASLRGHNRGHFFETIENEEQAVELARLAHPNATILNSKEEYESIVSSLRKIEDWDEKKWVVGSTNSFRTHVKRIPSVGFEVHSVYIKSFHDVLEYRDIVKSVTYIAFDGRTSERVQVLLRAPVFRSMNRPTFPGEKAEFGLVAFKPGGSPIMDAANRLQAATQAYNKAIRGALSGHKSLLVAKMVSPTKSFAKIPAPHDLSALIKDESDWPNED